MFKNFSPQALGINGRQSELIELTLTYAFRGMDIDMTEMLRRSQRTSIEDAAKYLRATDIRIGGFELDVDLDADDETFATQVATLSPLADLANQLEADRGYIRVPAATDRLAYNEFFEVQTTRLSQIAEKLAPKNVKLAIGFSAGSELGEGKEFPFVRNVDGIMALVKSVSGSNVGLLLDTWDWVVGEGSIDQIRELTADQIVAVRMASVAADVDPEKATSADRVVPEKTGSFDHVELVKHLDSIGFDGPVSPSSSPMQHKGQTRESIVQRAQEAVDGISKEAGLHVAQLPMELIVDIPYEPMET